MEQNEDNSKETFFSFSHTQTKEPILICPNCYKGIPFVSFQKSKKMITISILCPCLETNQEYSLSSYIEKTRDNSSLKNQKCIKHGNEAKKYCLDCLQWLCHSCLINHNLSSTFLKHLLCDFEMNIRCAQHNLKYSHYCQTCKKDICSKCQSDHKNHKTISLINCNITEIKNKIQEIAKIDPVMFREINQMMNCILNTQKICHNSPLFFLMNITEALANLKADILKEPINSPKKLIAHTDKVVAVLQLKSGVLVSYSLDCSIIIWDVTKYQPLATLKEHTKFISKVLEYENDRLVSCSGDLSIKIWHSKEYICLGTIKPHTKVICEIVKLPHDLLASRSLDYSIKIWNITSFQCIEEVTLSNNQPSFLCFLSTTNQLIAYASDDKNSFLVYDLSSSKLSSKNEAFNNKIEKLIPLNNGDLLMKSKSSLEIMKISKSSTFQEIKNTSNTNLITQLSTGPIAAITQNNSIKFITNARCTSEVSFEKTEEGHIIRLFELKDGRLVTFTRHVIKIMNPVTYKCITIKTGHLKYITTVIELPKGQLGSCSWDGTMKIWSTSTFEEIITIPIHTNWIPFTLSNDQIAIVGKEESIIELW